MYIEAECFDSFNNFHAGSFVLDITFPRRRTLAFCPSLNHFFGLVFVFTPLPLPHYLPGLSS